MPSRPVSSEPRGPEPAFAPRSTERRARVLMLSPDCYMIDRRILQQARSLTAMGLDVTLLSGFESPREERYAVDGIDVHRYQYDWDDERLKRLRARLPASERLTRAVNFVFMKVVRRALRLGSYEAFIMSRIRMFRADVVHVHDLPMLKYGALAAREWNVPLVFDAHEIYYEQQSLPLRHRILLRRQERRHLGRTALFFTVNDAIADHYEHVYGRRPRVLLNCADAPPSGFDAGSRRRLRELAAIPHDAPVALFQGWISAERNIETLVRAAAMMPREACVVIIGYGEFEQPLRRIVEQKRLQDRVRFLGRVEGDELLRLTAGADVGVIPYQPIDLNHRLCSPNKFFEYVQCGVPVVAHDLPFFRSMATAHGVVHTGDLSTTEGMARTVGAMLGDADRLARMKRCCRTAAATLNWDVEGRKLQQSYREIILPRVPSCAP
jgi:glycosyltransferase involved in cell wall biosynthesis